MMGRLFLFGFIFTLFWGCSKSGPKIAAPAYLQIDDYTVITDQNSQGTNKQKFTDVLVSSSSTSYGYYSIPGKIPLPLNGDPYLIIRPVIKVNGLGAVRVDYPLMKGSDTNLVLTPGQITKFKPIFKYYPSVHFWLNESFPGGATQIINSNPSDSCVLQPYQEASNFDGQCLYMKLDAAHTVVQAQSFEAFQLPTDGTNVYLEINYKCNVAFEVGVIGTTNIGGPLLDQRSAGGGLPSSTWNKLYVNLTDMLRTPPGHYYWYLYFYSTYDATSTLNQIYIDNIKLISQH